jgi:hypothetical protein
VILLTCSVVSATVWLAIGVQRLRARRAGDEGPVPPTDARGRVVVGAQ